MATQGLTVTVTGPTGDLGLAVVSALERSRRVDRVIGMARRPFDPSGQGLRKTEYRQGDVQDRASVADAVKGADVVVHLAFSIVGAGSADATRAINVDGSRNVFEAALKAKVARICHASSVAAYGFHADNPTWLDEDVPARGSTAHYYSEHKAEVERVLADLLMSHPGTDAYVFRPCVVAGPHAQSMMEELPYFQLSDRMPAALTRLLGAVPGLAPVIPNPAVRFQLVHEDDVASAFLAGVLGRGPPGPYNLAGGGTLDMGDLATALDWYAVPVPGAAVAATAEVISRLPIAPERLQWIEAVRRPVLMKTERARRQLGWKPTYTSRKTLREMVWAFRTRAGAP